MHAKINGIGMNYLVEGPSDAPAVVFHHPLATDLTFWDEAAAALAAKWRVVRFDARGHGKTDATPAPYTFEQLSADVVGLMDHLGIQRAAFVGLSMGGMIAQYLGAKHGDRFSCLVIASSSCKVAPEMRHLWVDRVKIARAEGMRSQVEPCLARWLAPAARGRKDVVDRCVRMIEGTPIEGYAGWCGAIETLDMVSALGKIRTPVRVMVGQEDPATPVAASIVIRDGIAGAGLDVLPGVSHMLAIEDPTAFHKVLIPFLEANSPN